MNDYPQRLTESLLTATVDEPLEGAVLGTVLADGRLAGDLLRLIRKPAVFYQPHHQQLYIAIATLYENEAAIDLLSVTHECRRRGISPPDGGVSQWLTELATHYLGPSLEQKCLILFELSIKRYLWQFAARLARQTADPTTDALQLLEEFHQHGDKMLAGVQGLSEKTALDYLAAVLARIDAQKQYPQQLAGLPFGIASLDRLTGGIKPGNFIILAGRPGMGKSGILTHTLRHLTATMRLGVGLITLEMSGEEVMQRMLAAETGYSNSQLDRADCDLTRLHQGVGRLDEALPLWIHDKPLTLAELRLKALEWKRRYHIRLLAVDYIQRLKTPSGLSRQEAITEISNGLKDLAAELKIGVLGLSQLSRECERRAGLEKRPELADLRESGSLEQDANAVLFLFRPHYYGLQYDSGVVGPRTLEIHLPKQRNGPITERDNPIIVDYDLTCNVVHEPTTSLGGELRPFAEPAAPF